MPTPTGQTLKVHQAIARSLYENGVDTMFGLMGDANMFMVDSYIRECGGQYIAAANEAGATFMALGYAARIDKPGVCSITHGPAMTNTITGLVEGVKASLPMVLITGSTPAEDREHMQDAPLREFALTAGAGFEALRSPKTIAHDIATALRRARLERRPIVFDAPIEFDWKEAENYKHVPVTIPANRGVTASSDDLNNAIGIIAAAKRPIIVAGRGAACAEARTALLRLARRIEAPLATTVKGKDLFRGEAFNLGICGTLSSPAATEVIMESDCLIAFGASLTRFTLPHGAFRTNKRIVQVNLEPSEIGKYFYPDAGIAGDPAGVADLIVHWLDEAEIPASGSYTRELQERLEADTPAPSGDFDNGDGTVDLIQCLRRFDLALPRERIIVTDIGRFSFKVWKYMHVPGPQSLITTISFAAIGLSVSEGIGAAAAAAGTSVVVMCGDGGFMNGGLAEFNTAVRAKSDLIVVVWNDGAYGAEYKKFVARQMSPATVTVDWPDFAPIAIALGGEGITLRSEEDWPLVLRAIERRSKPLLIDVKINPDSVPLDY